MKREVTEEEREKRRLASQSENAPESHTPPSEDSPEQEVVPETEGDPLQSEGETEKPISKPKKRRPVWRKKDRI
jgi:hypothetical protein